MTLILSIPTRDEIVVAADGKTSDSDTLEALPDTRKIFELANTTLALVAGMGIKDLHEYMNDSAAEIRRQGLTSVTEIARYMCRRVNDRAWADSKKAHMTMIVAGYEENVPKIYVHLDNRELTEVRFYAGGSWEGAVQYIFKLIKGNNYLQIGLSAAEKAAVKLLARGEMKCPELIGGQGLLWHITPKGILKHDVAYLERLKEKYLH